MLPGTYIQFDLESTPLQIKTNSADKSLERIWLRASTAVDEAGEVTRIGDIVVEFNNLVKYSIENCVKMTPLPEQPPEEVDKTWTIRKTSTTLSIECNGVDVLNYQFSNSSDDDCVPTWGGDVVGTIKFLSSKDTASDSYRAKPSGNKLVTYSRHYAE